MVGIARGLIPDRLREPARGSDVIKHSQCNMRCLHSEKNGGHDLKRSYLYTVTVNTDLDF